MIAVSASAGLFLYDRNGALIRSYRTGIELPPAELGSITVGTVAGSAEPELFIATRGEGLLAFNGAQLSPDPAGGFGPANRHVRPGAWDRAACCSARNARECWYSTAAGSRRFNLASSPRTLRRSPATTGTSGSAHSTTASSTIAPDNSTNCSRRCPIRRFFRSAVDGEMRHMRVRRWELSSFVMGSAYARSPMASLRKRLSRRGETLYIGTEDEGIIEVPLQSRPAPRVAFGCRSTTCSRAPFGEYRGRGVRG